MPAIYVTEYPDGESRGAAVRLRQLIAAAAPRFSLAESPEGAELILVTAPGNEIAVPAYIRTVIAHPVISAFPDKAFSVSFRDGPIVFHHGVYESGLAGCWTRDRVVPGFYQLSGTVNPEVVEPGPGAPVKRYLASFIGRNSHPCRARLFTQRFRRGDLLIENSSDFNLWSEQDPETKQARLRRYGEVLRASKFALCPRGSGTGSIRLYEALKSGVAPVVIADGWIPPADSRWEQFCLTVPESALDRLEGVLEAEEPRAAERGALAHAYYRSALAPSAYVGYLWRELEGLQRRQRIPERHRWRLRHLLAGYHLARFFGGRARSRARDLVVGLLGGGRR